MLISLLGVAVMRQSSTSWQMGRQEYKNKGIWFILDMGQNFHHQSLWNHTGKYLCINI
ncbi:MAG: hypothetical protein KME59_23850 [Trichormus sp. ATA11-4-KO1]|jgi:hypothetical protein|nr:hypothetical protein [Trichormus sp. ATA11-4-KO1]